MEPPKKKGLLTMKDIFAALPPKNVSANQIAVLYVLSSYSGDEQMLGQYVDNFFTEDALVKAAAQFKENLMEIEREIQARGSYLYIRPSKVPNSTAI